MQLQLMMCPFIRGTFLNLDIIRRVSTYYLNMIIVFKNVCLLDFLFPFIGG